MNEPFLRGATACGRMRTAYLASCAAASVLLALAVNCAGALSYFSASASVENEMRVGMERPAAYAVYTAGDATLTFLHSEDPPVVGGELGGQTISAVYDGLEGERERSYDWAKGVPWQGDSVCQSITRAVFADEYRPVDMSNLFRNCPRLSRVEGLGNVDTSSVVYMDYLFGECASLQSVDVSSFDTGSVEDMMGMFSGCRQLTGVDVSSFDTAKVGDVSFMFCDCASLSRLDMAGLDMSSVTWATGMFSGCGSLEAVDMTGVRIAGLKDAQWMFSGCFGLREIKGMESLGRCEFATLFGMFEDCRSMRQLDLSGFDVSSVAMLSDVFRGCWALESVDITSWSTSKATTLRSMFEDCGSLTRIEGLDRLDTSSVTDMKNLFKGCASLESVDVSSFDTSSSTDISQMFRGCSSLRSLDLTSFDTSRVRRSSGLFCEDGSLATIYVSEKWSNASVTQGDDMFAGCVSLQGGNGTKVAEECVYDCSYARLDADGQKGYFTLGA